MFNLFVLWLCKNDKRMLFEQDGYKTFGEKLVVVSCCRFVTLRALIVGRVFIRGVYEQQEFLDIRKNALFRVLWHF